MELWPRSSSGRYPRTFSTASLRNVTLPWTSISNTYSSADAATSRNRCSLARRSASARRRAVMSSITATERRFAPALGSSGAALTMTMRHSPLGWRTCISKSRTTLPLREAWEPGQSSKETAVLRSGRNATGTSAGKGASGVTGVPRISSNAGFQWVSLATPSGVRSSAATPMGRPSIAAWSASRRSASARFRWVTSVRTTRTDAASSSVDRRWHARWPSKTDPSSRSMSTSQAWGSALRRSREKIGVQVPAGIPTNVAKGRPTRALRSTLSRPAAVRLASRIRPALESVRYPTGAKS